MASAAWGAGHSGQSSQHWCAQAISMHQMGRQKSVEAMEAQKQTGRQMLAHVAMREQALRNILIRACALPQVVADPEMLAKLTQLRHNLDRSAGKTSSDPFVSAVAVNPGPGPSSAPVPGATPVMVAQPVAGDEGPPTPRSDAGAEGPVSGAERPAAAQESSRLNPLAMPWKPPGGDS
eukprot:TRINITY_DN1740_c0_g1_i1.p1 TRINITY_DN1740_c0_g1~~TRINITY_DN1740_c0_g1_i1.p1  ORF type:complete len:201 (+),score=44.63 TRINITY_DN1740_c0_g1_i1:72-605(+)